VQTNGVKLDKVKIVRMLGENDVVLDTNSNYNDDIFIILSVI